MGEQTQLSKLKLIITMCLATLLTGCAIPGTYFSSANVDHTITVHNKQYQIPIIKVTPKNIPKYREREYHVGKHDILSIIVWQHPELTTSGSGGGNMDQSNNFKLQQQYHQKNNNKQGILVNEHGNIFFPYAGNLHVAGKTVSQISHMLTKKLSQYIKHPQVSVRVAQFRSKKAYLLGEVGHQQLLALNDQPTDVLSAINKAGGLGQAANSANIYVFRWDNAHPKVYWLNLGNPAGMMIAEQFVLKNRDILYIAPAGVADWNRVISQVMPTMKSAWFTYRLTNP